MKVLRTSVAVLTLAAAAAVGPGAGLASAISGGGVDATALYDNGTKLARFDTNEPEKAQKIGDLDNLVGDTTLVGIDRRVQNNRLYGVGDEGGIYVLSTTSANARKVGQLSVDLDGTAFGVDFNPAANALRIVSNTGQNLRQPFGPGEAPVEPTVTVADGALTYPATPTAPPTVSSGITAAAYTNNDLNPDTGTTLFDLDTALDQVVIQAPANAGLLSATGKLGHDLGADAGFDIYSNLSGGKTSSLKAFAVGNASGTYRFYSVDLLTGDADREGTFGKSVSDIAIDLDA